MFSFCQFSDLLTKKKLIIFFPFIFNFFIKHITFSLLHHTTKNTLSQFTFLYFIQFCDISTTRKNGPGLGLADSWAAYPFTDGCRFYTGISIANNGHGHEQYTGRYFHHLLRSLLDSLRGRSRWALRTSCLMLHLAIVVEAPIRRAGRSGSVV